MAPAAAQPDDDPIVAEYDVFITPELEDQLYVLQYLDREKGHGLTKLNNSEPSQLRIKEESGYIEVDVPLEIRSKFNRPAGVKWGEALRKTKGFGQKAYGISAGFERAMPRSIRAGPTGNTGTPAPIVTEDDDNFEEWIANLEDANEKGHVLNTQTFGGEIPKTDGKGPSYLLGAFRDKELHLTRINGLVRMRTQFHHIDATAQLEIANRRREKESQDGAKPAEPKALLPVIRKAGGDTTVEITQAFMKAANVERWKKLKYADEDSDSAFAFYNGSLFLDETSEAPQLRSNLTIRQYLDIVCAPSNGKGFRKKASHRRNEGPVEISDISDGEEVIVSAKIGRSSTTKHGG